ncbi:hypothetical protein [Sphingomonas desiccabilis]|nr:hypothetical protein [Sphingomonas desiccabilis]
MLLYWLTVAALISLIGGSVVSAITSIRHDRRTKGLAAHMLSLSSSPE